MISLQSSMHWSQIETPGPAMSRVTCWLVRPQNEQMVGLFLPARGGAFEVFGELDGGGRELVVGGRDLGERAVGR
jgi:hypothetical protein